MKTGAVKPMDISLTVAFFFSESQFCSDLEKVSCMKIPCKESFSNMDTNSSFSAKIGVTEALGYCEWKIYNHWLTIKLSPGSNPIFTCPAVGTSLAFPWNEISPQACIDQVNAVKKSFPQIDLCISFFLIDQIGVHSFEYAPGNNYPRQYILHTRSGRLGERFWRIA